MSTPALQTDPQRPTRIARLQRKPGGDLCLGVALDIDWCPGFWGLAPDAAPSAEVLRRFRPLGEKASLILAAAEEAMAFFGSADPATLHGALAKRPAVLVTDRKGTVRWCLGGRQGTLSPAEEKAPSHPLGVREAFTAALLDGLRYRPELLDAPAPGGAGVAGPGPIEALLRFASACATRVGRTEGAIEPHPGGEAVKAFLNT